MSANRNAFRPRLEGMEDRLTPSTVVDPLTLKAPVTVVAPAASHGPRVDVPFKVHGEWILSDAPAAGKTVTFSGTGTATHLGKWTATGEITFEDGEVPGSLAGTGIVAFTAANGEMIVARLEMDVGPNGSTVYGMHWQDSVTFSYGTTVSSTGRFIDPPFGGVGGVGNFRVTSAVDNQLISSFKFDTVFT